MIQELFDLFKRLVVAVETIAQSATDSPLVESKPVVQTSAPAPQESASAPASAPSEPASQASNPATVADTANPFLSGVELDSKGHYWDEEIHTGQQTKNADGTWKLKRGIDRENLVTPKLAEQDRLRAEAQGKGVPAQTSASEPATVAAGISQDGTIANGVAAPAPVMTPVPAPVPNQAPAPAPVPAQQATVRLPAHMDSQQFTRQDLMTALEDSESIYGDTFAAAYTSWLEQSQRQGTPYDQLDDAIIPWMAYMLLDFIGQQNG